MLTAETFDRIFGVVARKPIRQSGQHLRDFPTYTIPEAAVFLGLPERTLRSWYLGKNPIFTPPARAGETPLLSFRDLVDSHIVQAARIHHKVPMGRIRSALKMARHESNEAHPLQDERIKVFARCLVRVEPGKGRRKGVVVNLSRGGQTGFSEVIKLYTRRIVKDHSGDPIGLFPWRFKKKDDGRRPVAIHPDIMSGRLVVAGTRIPVSRLAAEALARKPIKKIARDYRLTVKRVKEALRHLDTKAA